tara:strand:+ start:3897 stop:4295 length:399 start_codon:yes stop_codon:yes gene_type:complete
MAERKKTKKKRSVVRELGKAYASVPKQVGKTAKRYAKNFYEGVVKEAPDMIRELPRDIANIPQVQEAAKIIRDPFLIEKDIERMGGKYKVPKGKMGGGRGKARVARNMKEGGEATIARGSGAARPQVFRKNG